MKSRVIATLFMIVCLSHVLAASNEQYGHSGIGQRTLSNGTTKLKSRLHAWLSSKTKVGLYKSNTRQSILHAKTTPARTAVEHSQHTTKRSMLPGYQNILNRFKVPLSESRRGALGLKSPVQHDVSSIARDYKSTSAHRGRQQDVYTTQQRDYGVTDGHSKVTDGHGFITSGQQFKNVDHLVDTTGQRMDRTRNAVDITGHNMDTTRHHVDTTGHHMDTTRHHVDTTGHHMGTTRHPFDTSEHRMSTSSHSVYITGHHTDTPSHLVHNTEDHSGHQAYTTERQISTIEHQGETAGHRNGTTEHQADTTRHRLDGATRRVTTTASGHRTITTRTNVGYKENTTGNNSHPYSKQTAEYAPTHLPTNSDIPQNVTLGVKVTLCDTFICDDNTITLGVAMVCDGIPDCADGSDESTPDGDSCLSSKAQCPTGVCISKNNSLASAYKCGTVLVSECDADTQFSCLNGKNCIAISDRCNGIRNCDDGTDELSCPCKGDSCSDDRFISGIIKCDTFICDNGDIALGTALVCDGIPDCNDGSDEAASNGSECLNSKALCHTDVCISTSNTDQVTHSCGPAHIPQCDAEFQFSCDMGKTCIPSSNRCDAVRDCDDGTDEAFCQCPGFTCDNGQCVSATAPCDSYSDCDDASDESDARCLNYANNTTASGSSTSTSTIECGGVFASEPFRCGDGACVEMTFKCDGKTDCLDGSDEAMCPSCDSLNFVCGNGRCASANLVCDGVDDCGDNSDEVGLCNDNENFMFGSKVGSVLAFSFIGIGAFTFLVLILVGVVYQCKKGKHGKRQRSIEYVLAPPPYEGSVSKKQADLCFVNPVSELNESG